MPSPRPTPTEPAPRVRVLFVCLGNICRSPMAEAVFRHKVAAAGLAGDFEIDSAGTGGWHAGEPPHHGTRRVLAENGIGVDGLRARQIAPIDLERFDYVLTMDSQNLADVRRLTESPRATVRPLLAYGDGVGGLEVPDPYYTGGFEGVYAMIDAACDALLAAIRRDRGL